MELASCRRSGTWNFDIAPGYSVILCTPGLKQQAVWGDGV
jgi:hypothetical protein